MPNSLKTVIVKHEQSIISKGTQLSMPPSTYGVPRYLWPSAITDVPEPLAPPPPTGAALAEALADALALPVVSSLGGLLLVVSFWAAAVGEARASGARPR